MEVGGEVSGDVIRIWVYIAWESITNTSIAFIIHILENKALFFFKDANRNRPRDTENKLCCTHKTDSIVSKPKLNKNK